MYVRVVCGNIKIIIPQIQKRPMDNDAGTNENLNNITQFFS